jgi:DNA modification methylase
MSTWRILEGDCRNVLRSLPAQSVHTCVTSPPYEYIAACDEHWRRGKSLNGRR